MTQDELQISYDQIPKVLFLGNGVNRAFDFLSWDKLLESISSVELNGEERKAVECIPYPFKSVILTSDHVDQGMKKLADDLTSFQSLPIEEELLRAYAAGPFDAILTTNYTYELEKALDNRFSCAVGRACRARRCACETASRYEQRQLHTYFRPTEAAPPIWHIHGEAARPDTMVIGHYYYGKLLAKMQQLVSGTLRQYAMSRRKQDVISPRSWIDYFLLSDVYMVGIGLSLSEMDLWWLINCKKRHFPERKTVLFKPDILPEERLLASSYGVEVIDGKPCEDYREYYRWVLQQLNCVDPVETCLCEKSV